LNCGCGALLWFLYSIGKALLWLYNLIIINYNIDVCQYLRYTIFFLHYYMLYIQGERVTITIRCEIIEKRLGNFQKMLLGLLTFKSHLWLNSIVTCIEFAKFIEHSEYQVQMLFSHWHEYKYNNWHVILRSYEWFVSIVIINQRNLQNKCTIGTHVESQSLLSCICILTTKGKYNFINKMITWDSHYLHFLCSYRYVVSNIYYVRDRFKRLGYHSFLSEIKLKLYFTSENVLIIICTVVQSKCFFFHLKYSGRLHKAYIFRLKMSLCGTTGNMHLQHNGGLCI